MKKEESVCRIKLACVAVMKEEDEDLVCKQATTTKKNVDRIDELTNALCVGKACRAGLQAATNREFPVCREGSVCRTGKKEQQFPVCRDGSMCRISQRALPCEEEVVCQLQMTNRGRSVSPR